MNSTGRRKILAPFLVLGILAAPWLVNCGALKSAANMAGGGKCPEMNVDAILAYDFATNFKINVDAATKLKGGVAAAVELKGFADKIDADLKVACSGIAKDLGQSAEPKSGHEACELAAKAIGEAKGKLGANARLALVIKPPACRADLNVVANCAGKCDAKLSGGKAKVECEPGKLSGECSGKCEGSCDIKGSAKCDGECNGSCDAEIKGTCGGKCNGKCDGKDSKGSCAGTCEGKCEGGTIKGQCKGKCGGSCEIKAGASCDGTCSGKCSVEFKEPKCSGEIKPPEMSADCKAHCDTQASAKAECTPAQVSLAISGAADEQLAGKLKGTIEKNLPVVLKVAIGLGERAGKVAANAKASIDGVQGSVTAIAQSSGDASKATMIAGNITACFGDTFKGALDAAGSVKANVDVSVKVKASASASGSASGKTG